MVKKSQVRLEDGTVKIRPKSKNIERIMTMGTPGQIQQLNDDLKWWREYDLEQEKSKPALSVPEGKVEKLIEEVQVGGWGSLVYDDLNKILWDYYRNIVWDECGIEVQGSDMEESSLFLLKNYLLWLMRSKKGEFDYTQSLFIYGDLGIGKSTIALAGHYMSKYLEKKMRCKGAMLDYVNMDDLFLRSQVNSSLSNINPLFEGGWVFDEFKEKHFQYKHYGNDLMILNDILSMRHNLWKRTGCNTVITSNLTPAVMIEKMEDDRLADRIYQQYIPYELKGSNKRIENGKEK